MLMLWAAVSECLDDRIWVKIYYALSHEVHNVYICQRQHIISLHKPISLTTITEYYGASATTVAKSFRNGSIWFSRERMWPVLQLSLPMKVITRGSLFICITWN